MWLCLATVSINLLPLLLTRVSVCHFCFVKQKLSYILWVLLLALDTTKKLIQPEISLGQTVKHTTNSQCVHDYTHHFPCDGFSAIKWKILLIIINVKKVNVINMLC